MTELRFPSSYFPGIPAVGVDVPPGWQPRVAPGAVLGAIKDKGDEEFSPNVIVTHVREEPGFTLDTAVAGVVEYVQSLAEVESEGPQLVNLNDRPWALIEFAHVVQGLGTIGQIIAVAVIDQGSVVDVVRATGSAAPGTDLSDYQEVRTVFKSLTVETRA